jgi:hypothetical protein
MLRHLFELVNSLLGSLGGVRLSPLRDILSWQLTIDHLLVNMSAYNILQSEVESCTEVHICQTCLGYGTRTSIQQVLVCSN